MSFLHALVFAILATFSVRGNDVVERLGVPGPLRYSATSFELKWTRKPADNYFVQEYVPPGESLEKFRQMLTLSVLVVDVEAKTVAAMKVDELEKRKKTDEVCNYAVAESPDGSEVIVDFILSDGKNGNIDVVEFNVRRYSRVQTSDKTSVVLVYAYAVRAYADEIESFLSSLGSVREERIKEMIGVTLPPIAIAK